MPDVNNIVAAGFLIIILLSLGITLTLIVRAVKRVADNAKNNRNED